MPQLQQCQILNPLIQADDRIKYSTETSQMINPLPHRGPPTLKTQSYLMLLFTYLFIYLHFLFNSLILVWWSSIISLMCYIFSIKYFYFNTEFSWAKHLYKHVLLGNYPWPTFSEFGRHGDITWLGFDKEKTIAFRDFTVNIKQENNSNVLCHNGHVVSSWFVLLKSGPCFVNTMFHFDGL